MLLPRAFIFLFFIYLIFYTKIFILINKNIYMFIIFLMINNYYLQRFVKVEVKYNSLLDISRVRSAYGNATCISDIVCYCAPLCPFGQLQLGTK